MSDIANAKAKLDAYRFFTLEDGKQQGDRFLEPWILILTMAKAGLSKRSLKRLARQLAQFFGRKEIESALALAGGERDALLESELHHAAAHYLDITKSDPGYNSSLFGLVKLKEGDRERKLASDVQTLMLTALLELDECPQRDALFRSLQHAFSTALEDADGWSALWQDTLTAEQLTKMNRIMSEPGTKA